MISISLVQGKTSKETPKTNLYGNKIIRKKRRRRRYNLVVKKIIIIIIDIISLLTSNSIKQVVFLSCRKIFICL